MRMIKKLKQRISNNRYAQKISYALSGTIITQLIPILFSPILSRLFTPEAFGVYTLFIAISAILSALISFSLDSAIAVAETKDEAFHIFKLLCSIAIVISLCSIPIATFFSVPIGRLIGIEKTNWVISLIPAYSMLLVIYQGFYYLYIRYGMIKYVASFRIENSVCVVASTLFCALFYRGDGSMVISQVVGYTITLLINLPRVHSCFKTFVSKDLKRGDTKYIIGLVRKYKEFPTKYMPSMILNNITVQLPSIALTSLFGTNIGGYYAMTNKVLNVPVAAVGSAFGDVYKNEAFEEKEITGTYNRVFHKSLKILLLLGIIPFLILMVSSPFLFRFIFGNKWYEAGVMSSYMTPMYLAKFIAVPLSFALIISKKHNQNFLLQLCLLIGSLMAFVVGGFIYRSWVVAILLYVVVFTVVYIIMLLYSRKLSKYRDC